MSYNWRLTDCNRTQTHNYLVLKQTLNDLAKLTKWLSCVVSTYLYGELTVDYLYGAFKERYSADSLWNAHVIW